MRTSVYKPWCKCFRRVSSLNPTLLWKMPLCRWGDWGRLRDTQQLVTACTAGERRLCNLKSGLPACRPHALTLPLYLFPPNSVASVTASHTHPAPARKSSAQVSRDGGKEPPGFQTLRPSPNPEGSCWLTYGEFHQAKILHAEFLDLPIMFLSLESRSKNIFFKEWP